MSGYNYRVVYKQDGIDVEVTAHTLKEIKEKTGLSKHMIRGRELRDKNTKPKKFNKYTPVVLVEKTRTVYKYTKDGVEHTFNNLKQGSEVMGLSISTVHNILKDDKLKEKYNITIV